MLIKTLASKGWIDKTNDESGFSYDLGGSLSVILYNRLTIKANTNILKFCFKGNFWQKSLKTQKTPEKAPEFIEKSSY